MVMTAQVEDLLERTSDILPITNQDIIFRGITAELMERIVQLKRSRATLEGKYDALEVLEQRIKQQGVSPDDHTLYTDLLEWRAINHEISELMAILESM